MLEAACQNFPIELRKKTKSFTYIPQIPISSIHELAPSPQSIAGKQETRTDTMFTKASTSPPPTQKRQRLEAQRDLFDLQFTISHN